jgi:hypothetical protein
MTRSPETSTNGKRFSRRRRAVDLTIDCAASGEEAHILAIDSTSKMSLVHSYLEHRREEIY